MVQGTGGHEDISIHALREEGDTPRTGWTGLSTNFYPRPPRGGRRLCQPDFIRGLAISIHALREEGDQSISVSAFFCRISIHALREEGDLLLLCRCCCFGYFYPRPPRGGRRRPACIELFCSYFYPRPPRGGRPYTVEEAKAIIEISIHALREEGDAYPSICFLSHSDFYPRPPRGGRQQKQRQNLYFQTNYTTFCTNLEEP